MVEDFCAWRLASHWAGARRWPWGSCRALAASWPCTRPSRIPCWRPGMTTAGSAAHAVLIIQLEFWANSSRRPGSTFSFSPPFIFLFFMLVRFSPLDLAIRYNIISLCAFILHCTAYITLLIYIKPYMYIFLFLKIICNAVLVDLRACTIMNVNKY